MSELNIVPQAAPAREIVFIDSRVKDPAVLLQGLAPGVEVVYIDAQANGLAQMAAVLGESGQYSAVHVFGHGDDGQLWLGNTFLDGNSLADQEQTLAALGRGITEDGDLLIYACDLGEGEVGAQFVARLAQLTGADVAASNDRTGAGGDWNLEITSGTVESAGVLSQQAMDAYAWSLATITVISSSSTGVGTLRAALASAQNGDIVTFASGMTVSLDTQLLVNKNITIDGDLNNDGVADVTLDGQNRASVIRVTSGTTATFDGLTITKGLASSSGSNSGSAIAAADAVGGGISNAGNLTLLNVAVTANAAAGGGGGGGVLSPNVGGGGGGGGGIGGQNGATGGSAGSYVPTSPSANTGGNGAGFNTVYMGGRGGNASGGGAGSIGSSGYTDGGAGGTATSGALKIGGGGGGSGFDATGGRGGSAVGGIYNDATGTLTIIGTSTISNNIGAGGGGGGGGTVGGNGGRGVGAIWNKGTLNITSTNNAAMAGNAGGSGAGGEATSGGTNGTSPTAFNNIFNDGGSLNVAYSSDVTSPTISSIVIANPSLNSGSTSTVTFTFNEPVFGLDISEINVPNGTLTSLATTNNITWTATLTAASDISDATNAITLNGSAVQDSAGNVGTGTGTSNNYTVTDTVAPTVTVVVADTALAAGETSLVTITFSEVVVGFTNADLSVENGTLTAVTSSDGGRTWTATLTPTADLSDTSNQISLNRAGVQDLSANPGVGVATSNNYAIDTARPTATIVVSDSTLTIGETSAVTITFSEAVTGFTNADLTVANGTLSTLTTSNNIVWTGTFTPLANISDTTNVITLDKTGVTDAAGNTGAGTTDSNNYVVDNVRPTATISLTDTNITAGETPLVTITFSEAVTGFTNADLSVPNGTLSTVTSSDGGVTWQATYTPNNNVSDTTNLISLDNAGYTDLAGNAGTGTTNSANFTIDTVRPSGTVVISDTSVVIGDTPQVTITFTEAVTGFSNADLTVANGSLSSVSSSDGGVTWVANFTPSSGVNNVSNAITLNLSGVANASGNPGIGTLTSNNYAIDTVRPTASIAFTDNALRIGETSPVTFTFSEAVTGFTNADLTFSNGTLSAVSSSDGGITWTTTFTPTANITSPTNIIMLNNTGVADANGNTGSGITSSANYAIDTLRPTASINMVDTALVVGETSLVTFTFSEAVTGFTNADLTVPNGTLSSVSSSDGGITWTATYTPNANVSDTSNVITLNNGGVTDLAGNAGAGTTDSSNFTVNTVQTTATVVMADTALGAGDTSLVTFTFNEAVTGFSNAALTLENGTLTPVSSTDGGITWTATFTPAANVTNVTNAITLDLNAVTAVSGNPSIGTVTSNNYAIDTLRPTATIVLTNPALKAGETSLVTITFNEAVIGFTNADLSVASGTLSAISSTDGGTTWTATLTPSAGTTNASNVIALDRSGVADLAGNAGTGVSLSTNYAVDTTAPTATITLANPALKAGDTSLVTFTFSEAVTGFSNASLTVPNGTLSTVSSVDGGITWTAVYTPSAGVTSNAGVIGLNNAGVTDVAGNAITGTVNSGNITVNTVRPTATIAMSDTAVVQGDLPVVTITFSEAVTGFANDDLTTPGGTLSAVTSTDGGVTWTATFTPNGNVGAPNNAIALNLAGVTNAAGNAGTGTATSSNYSVDTVVPTPPSTGPTTPTTPASGVDGAQVSTSTAPDGSTITTIAPVRTDRVDDPASTNTKLADVPLVRDADGQVALQVSVPVGVGLRVQGNANASTGDAATAELVLRIREAGGSSDLLGSGQSFAAALGSNTTLTVRTIAVSTGDGFDRAVPLVISGNATDQQAIVLDTRALPANSFIKVDNVNFLAVMGSAHLIGGAGSNTVFADDDSQFIVLGADDDVIHGGGANDTVGSLRGQDQTFGDAGDDVVYGGTDNDTLSGGTGNDRLNGGFGLDTALQSGTLADYTVSRDGNTVVLTHRASGEIDRLLDVEVVNFDSGRSLVIAHEASDVAMLTALHPTAQLIELNLTRAVTAGDGNDVVTPTLGIGLNIDLGAGQDVVRLDGGRADVHLEVEAGRVVELTRLEDGAMLSFRNTELLAFANGDVTVLAQSKEQAIVGRSYELILDRNVDVEGFQFWADMLQAGASLQAVMEHIVHTPEASGVTALSDSAFLDQLYLRGFDRAADASGKAFWMESLARGETRAKVLEGFAGSTEAIALIGSTVDVSLMT